MRTQVAIVGAGPAGLVLAALLARDGVDTVVVEARERSYVEARVRAGVLEAPTVSLLEDLDLADRLHRDGLVHEGFELLLDGEACRVDLAGLTGRSIVVYGQQEVVRDLVAARLEAGLPLHFGTTCEGVDELDGRRPVVRLRDADGVPWTLECDVVVGADGFHGICRTLPPAGALHTFVREHPFGWLGVLAHSEPVSEELIYARHERGFALASMRSPDVTRLYVQCAVDDDPAAWPDERVWSELHERLDRDDGTPPPADGEIFEKGVTAMRSYVGEPLRHGRLLLVGDAAHIVPPTGAKGMNLAIADVALLAPALSAWVRHDDESLLPAWERAALRRVWRAQDFSTTMTLLLHRQDDPFEDARQRAALRFLFDSEPARRAIAENYVGIPLPV